MTVQLVPTTYTMYNQGNGTWKTTEPSGEGNLPPGFTRLESREFGTANEAGWWNAPSNYAIVADASPEAQSRSGNVGRITYVAGYAGGGAPTSTGIDLANSPTWVSGSDEIFLRFRYKVSANWQAHGTGTNKIFFITMSGQGGGGDPCFVSMQTNLTPDRTIVVAQGVGASTNWPDTTSTTSIGVTFNQWTTVEIHLKRNSAVGSNDGSFTLWEDGLKTQEDLACDWYSTSGAKWDSVRWEPTWGGSGGTVAEEMYMYMSFIDVYVKGGTA